MSQLHCKCKLSKNSYSKMINLENNEEQKEKEEI